jgi:pyrimidine operon attenuation protein/uracil phosphoribosyltransferase
MTFSLLRPDRTGSLVLDAEALYRELLRGVRSLRAATRRLVGITSGGAWLAERLQADLGWPARRA